MGDDNWLWTEGIRYERVATRCRHLPGRTGTEALLAERGIDFVVIGPMSETGLQADEAAFRARYPVLSSGRLDGLRRARRGALILLLGPLLFFVPGWVLVRRFAPGLPVPGPGRRRGRRQCVPVRRTS